ncbi:vascular plant-like leucine rich repeat transmembrane-like protein kinase, partial [Thalassiosira pseudonana CCMP1335]
IDPSQIAPSLPSALGKLLSLRLLNLSSNQIQGTIPKTISQLPNLEIIDISSNDLVGSFPYFESEVLRVLDISKNRFHGKLPKELFAHPDIGKETAPYLASLMDTTMQNLQYFDIGFNLFSGTICNNIGNFKELQALYMEHNRLIGTIPKALYRGSGVGANPLPLVQLFLQQNDLSGTLPSGLATLPNLKELYVDGNKLTGSVPDSLCKKELNNVFLGNKQAARG